MNSYQINNGYPYPWYQFKTVPENRLTPNRRLEFQSSMGVAESLGQGFIRYTWERTSTGDAIWIAGKEYLDCRLNTQNHERVISAGFSTDPLENIYIVQEFPRHPNVMAVLFHNNSNTPSRLLLTVVVKTETGR